jgi:hypothetical protein
MFWGDNKYRFIFRAVLLLFGECLVSQGTCLALVLLLWLLTQVRFRGVMCRVGQNRIYAPYMTVYLVISLTNILYIPNIYRPGRP